MIERSATAAAIALVVTILFWVVCAAAVLLDKIVPWWVPLPLGVGLFVTLFLVDYLTASPPPE